MNAARDTRGPRAADRREAKLGQARLDYPHFTEAERIAWVDLGEWPSWSGRGRRWSGGEGWYE